MAERAVDADLSIVRLSEAWIEGYLDLCERDDALDPLYGRPPRDVSRARALSRMKAPRVAPQVHLLAVRGRQVVGSGRAVVIPGCGGQGDKPANLSLLVSPECRRTGIGTALLDRVCAEMASHGVNRIEIGILDSWGGWAQFLRTRGFVTYERFTDAILRRDVPLSEPPPVGDATVRPIRLPEERGKVLAIYNGERGRDLPKECAVLPGQPAWWEVEPDSRTFDPAGFIVAEDRETGELVGYASSALIGDEEPWGRIDYVDVVERFLGTGLWETLILRVEEWLRRQGAIAVRTRVHPGYRDEEKRFQRLGFDLVNPASVWCRPIAGSV